MHKSGVTARAARTPQSVSEAAKSWLEHTSNRLEELAPVAAVYPDVYTLGVLEALSEERDNLNAQIRNLVEIGNLQLSVSNRQLSGAARISSATANRWTDREGTEDLEPGIFDDIVLPLASREHEPK